MYVRTKLVSLISKSNDNRTGITLITLNKNFGDAVEANKRKADKSFRPKKCKRESFCNGTRGFGCFFGSK
jgi:hypothetical protein